MLCSRIRTALSARQDGERMPPGITIRRLDDHLVGCADCRRWDARARQLTADTEAHLAHTDAETASAETLLARLRQAAAADASAGTRAR
ncbi:zf-HC2 domain-containing protein [Streptomyces halobius]|uniref:Zf-HC2 domain-containing protein n=1 Tax=Streptomyces halobius TaxID=2879846 RepID=A0ABY4MHI3_9ACTN|nr:zf-HC2 domain-containing protein [Streptomyces halobius]UQA96993.1 zf-HC2 domain-containing protein [Streptomyces halobius]